jgi:DNA-binding NtrC family response regulator
MEQRMKRKCIVVGADKNTLHQVKEAARQWYDVIDTLDPEHSVKMLESHSDVSVFITQHDADHFDCIAVLEQVRVSHPDIHRVVMTNYQDLSRIIQGLHNGTIQKLVQKPINTLELQRAIIPFAAQAAALQTPPPRRLAG